jgi:uncharacterized protein
MKKILILSDTHGCFDAFIEKQAKWADEIWHAGDWGTTEVADKLSSHCKTRGVYGNIDDHELRADFKETACFEIEGIKVAMMHIAGYPGRYNAKAVKLIQDESPDLFICGHSHILKVISDKQNKHLHINPGAAGIKGFHKVRTMIRLYIKNNKVDQMEVIETKR